MEIAVVIPCYNHARYIGAAIESVLKQTRPPARFLVIDDGSTDGSAEVIRSFEKEGVSLVAQENAGAHLALNRAIETVAGDCELVSILNSDDLYVGARFEVCEPEFRNGETAVVCSELNLIDDEGEPLAEDSSRAKWFRAAWELGDGDDVDLCAWLGAANFPATTSNIIARAAYLRENPFRPYRFNHDYFFLAGAALRGRLKIVREPLLRYRVHASNTMNVEPAPLLREMLRMNLDLCRQFAPEFQDDAIRTRFYRYARSAWNNVSALHPGLLQVLLADLAARADEAEVAALVADLDVDELNRYPGAALVNESRDPAVLAQKIGELKRSESEAKADNSTLKDLNRLRAKISRSRWVALGQILGLSRKLTVNEGQTPTEKLEKLQARCEASKWLQFGRNLGWWQD